MPNKKQLSLIAIFLFLCLLATGQNTLYEKFEKQYKTPCPDTVAPWCNELFIQYTNFALDISHELSSDTLDLRWVFENPEAEYVPKIALYYLDSLLLVKKEKFAAKKVLILPYALAFSSTMAKVLTNLHSIIQASSIEIDLYGKRTTFNGKCLCPETVNLPLTTMVFSCDSVEPILAHLANLKELHLMTWENKGIWSLPENLAQFYFSSFADIDLAQIEAFLKPTSLSKLSIRIYQRPYNSPFFFQQALDTLSKSPKLKYLQLSNSYLDSMVFADVLRDDSYQNTLSINKKYPVLDTLDFDYCNIDSFVIDFKNTPQLRALNLSHNKIQSLTFKYRRGSTLQYLNLSYNPMLQKLPAKLFRLKKLRYLSIKKTAIPESELVKLQKQLPHCLIEK